MLSTNTTIFGLITLSLGLFYQSYLAPLLESGGMFRVIQPLNTEQCQVVEGLQACEKFVIHSSGLVYLACASSPYSRTVWMPTLDHLNATALRELSSKDYLATYDPSTGQIAKLKISGLVDSRGLNLHGMDVVPDEQDSSLLWIYLVNHRPPFDPAVNAAVTGADSVVEVLKTRLGSSLVEWVRTVSDPSIIITPNDIVGGSNGKEFWFTNDYSVKVGPSRKVHKYLQIKSTSIGYCHMNTGCKIAADKLYSSNGIVRDKSGRIWVGSSTGGYVTIHGHRADQSLVPMQILKIGPGIDNLSLAPDGSIIVAVWPQGWHCLRKAVKDVNVPCSAAAVRIYEDADNGYKVEKIYESDGTMLGAAPTTAAIYRDNLYLHGLMAHRMLVCKIPVGPAREG